MIKNLVFDVGGVLLSYRWQDMFLEQGLTWEEIEPLEQHLFRDEIWAKKLDSGFITVEQAKQEFIAKGVPHAKEVAWFLDHIEEMSVPRQKVWDRVTALKQKGYHIYLLSNYSQEMFEKHTKGADFLDVLDGGVISYQVHALKPHREIYEALYQKYALNPEECLFFDDRLENIEGSKKTGMQAIQVLSEETLCEKLDDLLK